MAPYDGYQQSGAASQAAYSQARMSQREQGQMDFAMQQSHAGVVIPPTAPLHSAPNPRPSSQPQVWHQPHPNFQHQQPPPPPQYQNYYPQSQGQSFAQPSPLQQFAAGQFSPQGPQEYWQPPLRSVQYQVPYPQGRPSQNYPSQATPIPPQHARRQPSASTRDTREAPIASPMPRPGDVNQQRSQQRTPSQHSQARPSQSAQADHSTPSQSSQSSQRPRNPSSTNGSHRSLAQPQQTSRSTGQPLSTIAPTPSQRTVAHVQIPVQQMSTVAPVPQHPRSSTRRCSNERKPVHIKQEYMPRPVSVQKPSTRQSRPPASSSLTELSSSQIPPTLSRDVDYQEALLSLSDEYVTAAHSLSAHLCSGEATEDDYREYHKLISTGMACLQSALANFRLSDTRKEARIRLRLATLLHEETENSEDAEEVLGKGIVLCQRERLVDTRYAMEHLLVRVVSKSSPKAAFKAVDKIIAEAEAYGHQMWVFALRFLRVSLSIESDGPLDASSVLKHLMAISTLADALQQTAVQVAAATLEALVYLRVGGPEAVELAQRSLASARTHQFEPGMEEMPQLRAALDCLDLACNFVHPTLEQSSEKMGRMHNNMDTTTKGPGWAKDGTFHVPMSFPATQYIEADTAGIFRTTPSGSLGISFKWLSRSQLYMIGFILSGFSMMTNNSENKRAETFLAEGLKLDKPLPGDMQLSLPAHEEMRIVQRRAALVTKLTIIFALCGRADWAAAAEAIKSLSGRIAQSPIGHDDYTTITLLHLGGVCKQGLGELPKALDLYSSPKLAFDPQVRQSPPLKDIRCLAALNSIFILCTMPSPHPENAQKLLSRLNDYCLGHVSRHIQSAFYLLRAHASTPDTAIIKTKNSLQNSLTPAQAVKNSQLLNIIMNTMTDLFFKDIVGKQALGSANAGRSLARKTQDPLWCAVAEGMYRELLERGGDLGNANASGGQIRKFVAKVPEGVKKGIGLGE